MDTLKNVYCKKCRYLQKKVRQSELGSRQQIRQWKFNVRDAVIHQRDQLQLGHVLHQWQIQRPRDLVGVQVPEQA